MKKLGATIVALLSIPFITDRKSVV